jgi:hypothetical protein
MTKTGRHPVPFSSRSNHRNTRAPIEPAAPGCKRAAPAGEGVEQGRADRAPGPFSRTTNMLFASQCGARDGAARSRYLMPTAARRLHPAGFVAPSGAPDGRDLRQEPWAARRRGDGVQLKARYPNSDKRTMLHRRPRLCPGVDG